MSQRDLFGAMLPPSEPEISYFALRPDPLTADAIEDLARFMRRRLGLSGWIYPADRLHLSLCAIGRRRADIEAAVEAADCVRTDAFPVSFDTITTFGGGQRTCLVLRCSQPIDPLDGLYRQLRSELVRHSGPLGRPCIVPHVTLVRPASRVPDVHLDRPVGWIARDFVLALKGRGRARDIGRWPFPQNGSEY